MPQRPAPLSAAAALALALLLLGVAAPPVVHAVDNIRNPALYCGACKGLFDEIEYVLSTGSGGLPTFWPADPPTDRHQPRHTPRQ